ncbi:hypothetical protein R1sor_000857 [Riccia sorocarpa]|uniref:CCHC-type domain-containing protein n=1 Tax=Riccia sorocarpa TaxID=122646 RepID=A0ABD3GXH0_9MARC
MRLEITQLRVLSRHLFLLVLKNQDQKDRLLGLPDLSFGGFPVILTPWTIYYNPRKVNVRRIATWVELPAIDPVLEHLGNRMLSELGQPTFRTITKGVNRYINMRGCVMMEEGCERPTKLIFDLPWGGVAVQEIKYQDVPNSCFKCRRPGHQARHCPLENNQGAAPDPPRDIPPKNPSNVTPLGGAAHSSVKDQPEPENDGFTPVPKHKGKRQSEEVRSPSRPRAGSNLFKILEDEDVTEVQLSSTGRSGASSSRQPGRLNPEPEAAYTMPFKAVSSRDTHNGKPELPEKLHQNSLPVVSPNAELHEQIKVKEATLEVSTNLSQDGASGNPVTDLALITMDSLGAWAEVEDNEMTEAGSRVVKGRPSTDAAYTPDRGNISKRRQTSSHQSREPQVVEQTPPEILYLDWQERVDDIYLAPIGTPFEPDPGEDPQNGELLPEDINQILNEEEDRALGPTCYMNNFEENSQAIKLQRRMQKNLREPLTGLLGPQKAVERGMGENQEVLPGTNQAAER